MIQPWDTISLINADLGSVCVRARSNWVSSNTPTKPPFVFLTQASALESKSRAKSKNALFAVLSTEGRVVGLC